MMKSLFQRILMTLTLLLGAMSAASAADGLSIDVGYIEPGETRTLAINLENEVPYYGFQADINLPKGLEFVIENGSPVIFLSSRADSSYSLVTNLINLGSLRVGAFSSDHTSITGSSGTLLYIKVIADDEFEGGQLALSNIRFIGESDQDVVFPDVTVDIRNEADDHFYIPDFKIAVGETKTISIMLDNETPFTAFQTDLYLPEGLNIVEDSFKLTDRGSSNHTISAKGYEDGRTRIVCMALSNDVFSGNSGALVEMAVSANKDIAASALIEMKNQIFTMANAREYNVPNSQTTITTERALVESVTLSQNDVTLKEGESQALNVEVLPEDSLNKDVKWSSSDEDIVTVSDEGVLTAISVGQAVIVVRSVYNPELYDECLVTVIPIDTGVADISIDNVSIRVEGHSIYLTGLRAVTAISITTIDGYRVYFSEANSSTERIDLDGSGIYIVKIGNKSVKLAIN